MSDPDDNVNTASEHPRCKFCGSTNVKRAGKRKNNGSDVQIYRCMNKECGRKFSLNSRYLSPSERHRLLETYYSDVMALRCVPNTTELASMHKLGKVTAKSCAGLSYIIRKEADRCKNGIEISLDRKDKLSKFLGIDGTVLKIKKIKHYYWHAVDLINKEPLHYEVLVKKAEDAIISFLLDLKYKLDYEPLYIVIDLEPNLLSAVKRVFPNSTIQACVFHRVYDNNKLLPTDGWLVRRIKKERLKLWSEFKDLCKAICYASDCVTKEKLVNLLKSRENEWMPDKRIRKAYNSFISNIEYYHTAQELGACPCTNNECEALIKLIKKLHNRMLGMKTLASARTHVKGFWAVYRNRVDCTVDATSQSSSIPTISIVEADYTLPTKKRSSKNRRKRRRNEPNRSLLAYC